MRDTVLKYGSDSPDGSIPITPPENWKQGSFLHYVKDNWRPVLAEGVVPGPLMQERDDDAQSAVSKLYNAFEKNKYHAGHLIPHSLGGSNQAYNMVVVPRRTNLSDCAHFERELKEQIAKGNMYLQVFVKYLPGLHYPSELRYIAYRMKGDKAEGDPWKTKVITLQNIFH